MPLPGGMSDIAVASREMQTRIPARMHFFSRLERILWDFELPPVLEGVVMSLMGVTIMAAWVTAACNPLPVG